MRVGLDQRHAEARIDPLQHARAGRAGEAAADDDDTAACALCARRPRQHRHRRRGDRGLLQEITATGALADHSPSRSVLLRAVPSGDGADLVVREPFGDTVHHRRGALARAELLHCGNDRTRVTADEKRHRRADCRPRRMAAGTGGGTRRSVE